MPINKVCEQCGGGFKVTRQREANRRFCGKECLRAHEAAHGRPASYKNPVPFTCEECGSGFTMKQSYLNAYRKKFGRDPKYCTMKCSDAGRRKASDERNKAECQNCGKIYIRSRRAKSGTIYREQKFCSPQCTGAFHAKRAGERFLSGDYGRHIKRNGYVWISIPAYIDGKKREMLEHRWVMSKKLGRELFKEETVHHINGDRSFNDLSNLELFSSRHGPGQRVRDKIAFAIEMLRLYPEFAREAGVGLVDLGQVNGLSLSSSPAWLPPEQC